MVTAKEYPCTQCSEVFNSGVARFHHGKKAHGVTTAPKDVDMGLREEPIVANKKDEDEIAIPSRIQKMIDIVFSGWTDRLKFKQYWRDDCNGYVLEVIVPKSMSNQWKTFPQYNFEAGSAKFSSFKNIDVPDVRTKPLNGKSLDEIRAWLVLVKKNILENAQKEGILLPHSESAYNTQMGTRRGSSAGAPNTFYQKDSEYPTLA